MTTNIFDLINKKKASLSGKKETIKPNQGNNFYIILPSWKGQGEFWKDCNRHWIKNGANEVQAVCACTMSETGHCDICDAIANAKRQYQSDPVFLEMISQWSTTRRILFNVLEVENVQTPQGVTWRAKDISDVKVLEVPLTVATAIFDAMNGLAIQGITDPVDLHNVFPINVVKSGSGKQGTKYSASCMMSPVRFADNQIATIQSSLKNLDEFVMEDDSAHGRALTSISANLGEAPAALPSNASVQMISAPVVSAPQTVAPIVQDLQTYIDDSIPFDVAPAATPAPQAVAQPQIIQAAPVQELSVESIDKMLSESGI